MRGVEVRGGGACDWVGGVGLMSLDPELRCCEHELRAWSTAIVSTSCCKRDDIAEAPVPPVALLADEAIF